MITDRIAQRPAARAASSALWGARCDARGSVAKLDQGTHARHQETELSGIT